MLDRSLEAESALILQKIKSNCRNSDMLPHFSLTLSHKNLKAEGGERVKVMIRFP